MSSAGRPSGRVEAGAADVWPIRSVPGTCCCDELADPVDSWHVACDALLLPLVIVGVGPILGPGRLLSQPSDPGYRLALDFGSDALCLCRPSP